MKDIILFPIQGVYKYTIKIHENYRVDEELAIIMKLELIFASLLILVDPLTVCLLLVGNLLNIPLILWLGGKGDMWRTITRNSKVDYNRIELEEVDGETIEIKADNLTSVSNKTINEKYFDENESILNKISSILRFGVIDGLKKFIKDPKGVFKAGLERLFAEDDIEYIKPDIFEEAGDVDEYVQEDEDIDNIDMYEEDNFEGLGLSDLEPEEEIGYEDETQSLLMSEVNRTEETKEENEIDPMAEFKKVLGVEEEEL